MRFTQLISLAALFATLLPVAATRADVVTYVVDPARSSLTLSGSFDGHPFFGGFSIEPNDPPPEYTQTDHYAGTILAERGPAGFQILRATVNANSDRLSGEALANYDFRVLGDKNSAFSSATGAIRNFSISFSSPVTEFTLFDASLMTAMIVTGQVDFRYTYGGNVFGDSSFQTYPMRDPLEFEPAIASSLRINGGIETLTIPVVTEFSMPATNGTLNLRLSGTIVAAVPIPEPASLSWLGLGSLVLTRRSRR